MIRNSNKTALDYDFEYNGICYNITDKVDKTIEVTRKENDFDEYSDGDYSGEILIPSTIKYNGITYRVTRIKSYSFFGCKSLEKIEIPNSVTDIGHCAFSGCERLTSIFIPKSVTKIGLSPFSNCKHIIQITIDSKNPKYDSRENCNAIIETATNILISGCNNSTIPNSVKKINEYAFTNTSPEGPNDLGLNYIVIPYSVYEICKDTFSTCENLDLAVIMNHDANIDKEAFPKWTKIFKFQRDTMYTIN